jgi:cobalt-zinc-cadmium efflux system membrane fusion protein
MLKHRPLFPFLVVLLQLPALSGCHGDGHGSEESAAGTPPEGEVWLTSNQVKDAQIATAPLGLQDVDDTILTSGRITFDDSRVTHVFSPVSGRVKQLLVDLGQRVKPGDGLAVIESPDIGIASSDVGKAKADLIASEHDLRRQRELLAQHAVSQHDYEQAEDNYRKALAEMERANQKNRLFQTKGSAIDTVTQTYTVRSEIAGEVILRNINPGVEVQGQYGGGTPLELFTIGDLDRVWVLADVYEMDLPRVKIGSPVTVRAVAFPSRTFTGSVDWVSGALDPNTRTARVRCSLDNADHALRPEMYVTAYLTVEQQKALALSHSALLRLGEQTLVFVEKGQTADGRIRFTRVPVQVDVGEGSKWVVIQHGLSAGEKVVTSGTILLSGML